MGFRCGIVGLPNVGKSTLFNALTAAGISAENYPFCTIEPNVGVVPVPDLRLDDLARIAKPEKIIPTTIEFVDIAGLVAGASKGEGLGNKFLAHIREVDAIAHVVRCFEDTDVVHVSGRVDPGADIEVINLELMLADLDTVARALDKAERNAKTGEKEAIRYRDLLKRVHDELDNGIPLRAMSLDDNDQAGLKPLTLLTSKPVLYIANVAEDGFKDNAALDSVRKIAEGENAEVVPVCAAIESEISALEPEDRKDFLDELGLDEPGLNRVIRAGYRLLDLKTFFTAGPKEVRAWTVRRDARAPQAAGAIHTDFEKGFIRAEVVAFDDYVTGNGEQGAKDAGRWRLEGKEYTVAEGDVCHFRFNV